MSGRFLFGFPGWNLFPASRLLGVDPGRRGISRWGILTSLQRPEEDPFFELFQIFGNQTSARLWWVLSLSKFFDSGEGLAIVTWAIGG